MAHEEIQGIVATAHTDAFQPLTPVDTDLVVRGGYSPAQARDTLRDFFNFLRENGPVEAGLGLITLAWYDPDQSRYRELSYSPVSERMLLHHFLAWVRQE
jgi:hypothetical protein